MQGLTPGRNVHYVSEEGKHLPAIVVEVIEPTDIYTPSVTLCIFDPAKEAPYYDVAFYSEANEPDTWHWIERA